MDSISYRERLLKALDGGAVDRPPVVCVNQTGTLEGMAAAGVYWPEAHRDGEGMARLAITGHTVMGFEAVRAPFDQTVEAEALGCRAKMEHRDEIPSIVSTPFRDPSALRLPERFEELGRIPAVKSAIRRIREAGDDLPVLGGVVGPFTLGGLVMGLWNFIMWTRSDVQKVEQTLEFTTEVTKAYAKILVEAGADIVVVEDMMASPDMLNPNFFKQYVSRHISDALRSIGTHTVLHICGNAGRIIDEMVSSGARGISIDAKTDLGLVREKARGRCAIVGNIDPVRVLHEGRPESVREVAMAALQGGVNILSPGCSITPYTPSGNTKALLEAAERFQGTERR